MNEIEKRLLINQYELMVNFNDKGFFSESIKRTEELIEPKQTEESACDMEEDEICKCGHHTKDHSYNTQSEDNNLYCDVCDCKDFVKRGLHEK